MYPQLQFPPYDFKIRPSAHGNEIYDVVRKKYVALTPEEWVRQHVVSFLIQARAFPSGRIKLEKSLKIQKLSKRADVVVYDDFAKPLLIVECKAPEIKLSQSVFEQIACYNMALHVRYLIVTNGLQHFFCSIDFDTHQCRFEEEIPTYEQLQLR